MKWRNNDVTKMPAKGSTLLPGTFLFHPPDGVLCSAWVRDQLQPGNFLEGGRERVP